MIKPERDKLIKLLPALYDAVISDAKWEDALDIFVDIVGAKSTLLFAIENTFETYDLAKGGGTLRGRRESFVEYSERFAAYEQEAMAQLAQSQPQSLIRDVDVWPDLKALRVREDFLYTRKIAGVYRRVGTRLNGSPAWFDACIVHFSQEIDEIPPRNLALISELLPHLAQVVELNRFFHMLQAKHRAALAALDRVKIGVCIVDPSSRIVIANDEANRIFALNDGVFSGTDQTIHCRQDDTAAAIKHAVQSIAATATGANSSNEYVIAVERRSGLKPFFIEVVPLRDSLGEIDTGFAGAMVSIVDPENISAFSSENVERLYGLTAAEAAVCKLLVDGWASDDIADARGVSIETIKSQTKSIYNKLNVDGRANLIREVLTVNPPIE